MKDQRKKLVVFCNGRSGSHLLGSYLNQHPELHFDFEKFGNVVKDQYTNNLPYYFSKYLPAQYLKWRMVKAGKSGYGLSFHLYMYEHTRFRIRDFHDHGFKIIRLNRDNALEQMLSHKVAFASKNWHRTKLSSVDEGSAKISLDITKALVGLKHFQKMHEQLDDELAPFPHLRLSYGRDLESADCHQETMNRVFNYLGLDPIALEASQFSKVYKKPYSDLVDNYDEFIQEAKMEGLLQEV